jgi:uncharacterized protein
MTRNDIFRVLSDHRSDLERLGAKSLAVFGSTARGQSGPDSDVDILVEFTRPVGLFEFLELKQFLESLLACKVDLGTRAALKPRIREQVLKEAVLVP